MSQISYNNAASICDGKRCENTEKEDADQWTACKEPGHWSKYTTHTNNVDFKTVKKSKKFCRNPEFRCKRNGGCDLTVTSQRKCRKCRYDLCVTAGMTHEAILTEEQKEVRFRKAIQKRKRQSGWCDWKYSKSLEVLLIWFGGDVHCRFQNVKRNFIYLFNYF